MTRDELIRTAAKIPPVSSAAAAEYGAKRDEMVVRINQRLLARDDIDALIGANNLEMMKDNHANHGLFIESVLTHFDPNIMVETVLWVFRAYRSRQFHENYWAAQLNAWVKVMQERLTPESYNAVFPIYRWMIVHIPQFTALTDD